MDTGERFQSVNRDKMKAAKKPTELPFYQTPEHVVTSSKIITEAKSSLKRSQLRSIPTRRPETPQESQRKLFPCHLRDTRDGQDRPPSAFSLDLQHFESDSRPVSGTKLLPLDHAPSHDQRILGLHPSGCPASAFEMLAILSFGKVEKGGCLVHPEDEKPGYVT
ncbi:Armadillo repeat-containing protein 2 [Lamellibrachia satsuma]|nr:Armadillo repeat-containing protein 2 [Lamellibrachia satsuma]